MTLRDLDRTLRTVAALRTLCLRLPHVPTPAEHERLRRVGDITALVAGWRRWWRNDEIAALLSMAEALHPGLVEQDRRLELHLAATVRYNG
jgi:hypothetical protein